jgi:DNA-binding CsgD family transcriptional regulator
MELDVKSQSKTFFINLLRQINGLIDVRDSQSRVIYSNKFTANMYGFKNEGHLIGNDPYGMRCPAVECADEFIAQDQMVIKSGKELTILDIHIYADNKSRILLTKKTPYKEERKINGIICHCTEIYSIGLSKICSILIKSDNKYHNNNSSKERSYIVGAFPKEDRLSPRELDCLFYLLRGKTMKETGKSLEISARTVETYIEQARMKLGCNNKSALIDRGLAEGYLNYIPSHILSKNISDVIYSADSSII